MIIDIISCPECGAEYFASEIFHPDEFFKHFNEKIIRDENHRIIYPNQSLLNTDAEFECDFCGLKFNISADIHFNCSESKKIDFNSDYCTHLKKNDIFMVED